jgi:hypothetical protein
MDSTARMTEAQRTSSNTPSYQSYHSGSDYANREEPQSEPALSPSNSGEERAQENVAAPEPVCWQCESAEGPLLCKRCLAPRTTPPPSLNSWDVGALILNKMIGSGIFTTPPLVLLYTGSGSAALGLWVGGFLYTILRYVRVIASGRQSLIGLSCSMFIYLQFARELPHTGGELIYVGYSSTSLCLMLIPTVKA